MGTFKHVSIDLIEYARMASSSAGIVHYNIARISKVQNQDKECEDHLESHTIPKLLEKRLQLDPVFMTNDKQNA